MTQTTARIKQKGKHFEIKVDLDKALKYKKGDSSTIDFLETEEDAPTAKFTFSSKDRDRVVDVIVKNLDAGRTQIMITCWSLQ